MQVLPLARRISFVSSRDSLPSRVIAAHGEEEVGADGVPHPDRFIRMPLISSRARSDSHASGSSLASQRGASRDKPHRSGTPPAAAGTSSSNQPHSSPGTESSDTPGLSSSTPEQCSSASGASSGVAGGRQSDPEGSASAGTSSGSGAEDRAGRRPEPDSEGDADVDSVRSRIGGPLACRVSLYPYPKTCAKSAFQPFGWGQEGACGRYPGSCKLQSGTSLHPGEPPAG